MTPPQAGFFLSLQPAADIARPIEHRAAAMARPQKGSIMKIFIAVAASFIVWLCWSHDGVAVAGNAKGGDVSAVNSSVRAEAGQTYGELSTVNGDVHVGAGATAESASTVNGSIRIKNEARVGSANTVNGSLHIDEGVTIEREAHTVNGDVEMRSRSRVGGDVATVSGDIELSGAEVNGGLRTVNGDIDLTDGTRVRGGITVKKSRGWGSSKYDPVRVHVCSTCVVEGELRFERPVKLTVDDGGKVGAVIGDQVTRD
jgi:DUF4097 and DUF4098 domain-containing protein YvlB